MRSTRQSLHEAHRTSGAASKLHSLLFALLGFLIAGSNGWSAEIPAPPSTIFRNHLLRLYPFGTVALVPGGYRVPSEAPKLAVLEAGRPTLARRTSPCLTAIAHYMERPPVNTTFAGVQLVRVLKKHQTPGVVTVARGEDFLHHFPPHSAVPPVPATDFQGRSLSRFAQGHMSLAELEKLKLVTGEFLLSEWHARTRIPGVRDATAGEGNRDFWATDVTEDAEFKAIFGSDLAAGAVIRVDNLLIKFSITDDASDRPLPPVKFNCVDPSLIGVAMRVLIPYAEERMATYYLIFAD